MANTRITTRTKPIHGAVTNTYVRISPTDGSVTLYQETSALRMRFSNEATAQEWANRYGVKVRPDGTSYWVDLTHRMGFDLYAVTLAWQREYLVA